MEAARRLQALDALLAGESGDGLVLRDTDRASRASTVRPDDHKSRGIGSAFLEHPIAQHRGRTEYFPG